MARTTKNAVAKAQTTEVANWEEELAAQADAAAAQTRSGGGGGKFFSTRAGVLSFDDNPMPGNQMAVVVVDSILENSYYEGDYDPSTPQAPTCFAFGRDEDDMEPHEKVDEDVKHFTRQNSQCDGCEQAEWGSARTGRGKACKNLVRMAVIPAGTYSKKGDLELEDEADHFKKAEVAFLKVPVMSVKNWSNYVKQLSANLRRPPHGVITRIYLEPDPKSQFRIMFEVIDKVPNELMPAVMARHKEVAPTIDFPYAPRDEDDAPAKQSSSNKLRGKAGAKPAAKGRR